MSRKAIIKFNGGRGALLCNRCNIILKTDFNPKDIEDKEYFCEEFGSTYCKYLRKNEEDKKQIRRDDTETNKES